MTTHEPEPAGVIPDAAIEVGAKAYAEATGYYVEFHKGLHSESASRIRDGVRAAIRAAQPFMVGDTEPVAWRWRDRPEQAWNHINWRPDGMDYGFVEPLYLHPALVSAPEAGKAEGARDIAIAAIQGVLDDLPSHDAGVCLDMAIRAVADALPAPSPLPEERERGELTAAARRAAPDLPLAGDPLAEVMRIIWERSGEANEATGMRIGDFRQAVADINTLAGSVIGTGRALSRRHPAPDGGAR